MESVHRAQRRKLETLVERVDKTLAQEKAQFEAPSPRWRAAVQGARETRQQIAARIDELKASQEARKAKLEEARRLAKESGEATPRRSCPDPGPLARPPGAYRTRWPFCSVRSGGSNAACGGRIGLIVRRPSSDGFGRFIHQSRFKRSIERKRPMLGPVPATGGSSLSGHRRARVRPLAFIWPESTLTVIVYLFGAYVLVDGIALLVALVRGEPVARRHAWSVGIMGALGVVVGVVTFVWPGLTALSLLYLVAIWAIAMGTFQVIAAIALRRELDNELWMAIGGLVSIVFGALLVAFPGAGLLSLVWLVGIWSVVFGVSSSASRIGSMRSARRCPSAPRPRRPLTDVGAARRPTGPDDPVTGHTDTMGSGGSAAPPSLSQRPSPVSPRTDQKLQVGGGHEMARDQPQRQVRANPSNAAGMPTAATRYPSVTTPSRPAVVAVIAGILLAVVLLAAALALPIFLVGLALAYLIDPAVSALGAAWRATLAGDRWPRSPDDAVPGGVHRDRDRLRGRRRGGFVAIAPRALERCAGGWRRRRSIRAPQPAPIGYVSGLGTSLGSVDCCRCSPASSPPCSSVFDVTMAAIGLPFYVLLVVVDRPGLATKIEQRLPDPWRADILAVGDHHPAVRQLPPVGGHPDGAPGPADVGWTDADGAPGGPPDRRLCDVPRGRRRVQSCPLFGPWIAAIPAVIFGLTLGPAALIAIIVLYVTRLVHRGRPSSSRRSRGGLFASTKRPSSNP